MRSGRRGSVALRLVVAGAAVAAAVAAAAATIRPGPFSVDEMTYLLMAKSFAAGNGFVVDNGFEAVPSPHLAVGWTKAVGGHLVSQYPDLWTALVAPAYRAGGFRGLFWVNVAAFLAVCALVRDLGRSLYGARRVGDLAVLLLAGATFAWEYAVAAWPHQLATAALVVGLWAVARGLEATTARARAGGWFALGGAAAGIAVGLRLDAAFGLAALALVLLVAAAARWSGVDALAWFAAGVLPGLAALAAANWVKFGLFSPFTYGPSSGSTAGLAPYLPLVAAGLAGLAAVALLGRPAVRRVLAARPLATAALALALAAAALALPAVRALALRLGSGILQLVVDLRIRDLALQESGLLRGPDRSLVYVGTVKKSLLQSCPYFVLAVPALAALARAGERRWRAPLLAALPATYVAAFGYFAWHGGLCFNLRYFVPLLPIGALLAAAALVALFADGGARRLAVWIPAAALAAGYFAARSGPPWDLARQGLVFLTLPLVLAALLAAALAAAARAPTRPRLRRAAQALALAAVVWAGIVCLHFDLRRTLGLRSVHAEAADAAATVLPREGLLLSTPSKLFGRAIEGTRLVVADPSELDYRGLAELVAAFEARGLPVYYGSTRPLFERLASGPLAGFALRPVIAGGPFVLLSIHAPASARAGAPTAPPP